ncbi:NAD(P)-binding domain-containing protein [Neotabrizicola shimadae]|uniref:NAD(P)-dependent oxidoreductase n=1 Tax=Neotabrizicola shimadae TaxID=2807096 RepID=A0A8G0ZXT1_9RHOB|nr:NAD(P)-binding domain-containing protein [Neotabrizicola shimadae]QYZ70866.1 NAD(P)-dependent oxidoreductase [Neotabrizicola shimadae]
MQISVLGTGAIGSAFAEAFLKAGHQVTVYNRSADKVARLVALGATHVATPAAAMTAGGVVLVAVTDGKALKAVLDGIPAAALSGAKILNASTTRVVEIAEIAADLAGKGADLAEVSVNVGPDQIREGQGMYLLGASETDTGLWTGLLTGIGSVVHRAGEVGDASRAELPLLMSYLFGLVAAAHVAAVVARDRTPDDILATYVYPALPAAQYAVPQMMARAYADASASVDAFRALADNAVADFAAMGYPTDVLEAMAAMFARASAAGFGGKDGSAVFESLLVAQAPAPLEG